MLVDLLRSFFFTSSSLCMFDRSDVWDWAWDFVKIDSEITKFTNFVRVVNFRLLFLKRVDFSFWVSLIMKLINHYYLN